MKTPKRKRIVIFASGNGTNAQNIIEHFQQGHLAKVVLVLSNKKDAKVLERAKALEVMASSFTRDELHSENGVLKTLKKTDPDIIVLAGFLLKFPAPLLQEFPGKVINIHPALLPKYGGKGMYGSHVHEAVAQNKEKETGITIHYVNEEYDEGAIIYQTKVALGGDETAKEIAEKVHALEYLHFPKVIESLLNESEYTEFNG
ncbi:MAG: phosphoribosylglycinamide formyltransferase [Bacteroidia bacterium]|nr:phosphoribosylglycinamide formyltransferase [Bacteroidia bacterium]NNM24086.1 phosphoribosylglycinamide formyltransferase [Flavobacteriaceae bacterium]